MKGKRYISKISLLSQGLVVLLMALSCEKVIEVELKGDQQLTIIEANVNSEPGNNYVILSRSVDFYKPGIPPMISGAVISIMEDDNTEYVLTEVEKGIYTNTMLKGKPGSKYEISITGSGLNSKGSSVMPGQVKIDSLWHDYSPPYIDGYDKAFEVYFAFSDPAGIKNFYRIKATNTYNGESQTYVFDDEVIDGLTTEINLFQNPSVPGDTLIVQLYNIDHANYEFYKMLINNEMGAMSTTLGNPVSTLSGENIIGAFGANAVDTGILILPAE